MRANRARRANSASSTGQIQLDGDFREVAACICSDARLDEVVAGGRQSCRTDLEQTDALARLSRPVQARSAGFVLASSQIEYSPSDCLPPRRNSQLVDGALAPSRPTRCTQISRKSKSPGPGQTNCLCVTPRRYPESLVRVLARRSCGGGLSRRLVGRRMSTNSITNLRGPRHKRDWREPPADGDNWPA